MGKSHGTLQAAKVFLCAQRSRVSGFGFAVARHLQPADLRAGVSGSPWDGALLIAGCPFH
jgi:hypothetical protein